MNEAPRPDAALVAVAGEARARRRRQLAVAVVLASAFAGIVYWKWPPRPPAPPAAVADTPPEDPRRAYAGPYRNIHPDARYVGDDACEACHADKVATYRRHPMGRSLAPIAQVAGRQSYDRAVHNPFEALGSRFFVERQGDRVWHKQTRLDAAGRPVYEYDLEVHYVIGSGRGGYSYITDRDGYLFWTPVSWYSQKKTWDLSPGFDTTNLIGRPITPDCLFCHANRAQSLDSYQNRYATPVFAGHAIGCERCHGPGERHADSQERLDIVNPGRLEPALREAVCQQCHLEGAARVVRRGRGLYDFRPGLPLEDFWSVFVSAVGGAERTAVNHVEQMYQSRCFKASAGPRQLGCVSCHDPHVYVGPEQRVAHYRARCLACHEKQGCSLPPETRRRTSAEDSCIDCHMPHYRATDVAHTAATDHRIVRTRSHESVLEPPPSLVELVPFDRTRADPRDPEQARDLGIGWMVAASKGVVAPARANNQTITLLAPAVRAHPGDVEAWNSLGWAHLLLDNRRQGLAAFEQALERDPDRERSLVGAALLSQNAGLLVRALGYWRQAAAADPWVPLYRRHEALLSMELQDWDAARRACGEWRRLDPASVEARRLWITCLLRDGRADAARAEFAQIEALRPPDLDALRRWFAAQLR